MSHKFFEPGPWFRSKTYGLGTGLPIAWQGWVFMLLHVLLVAGVALSLHHQHQPLRIILVLFAGVAPFPIYAARTEGGWKWRWGTKG